MIVGWGLAIGAAVTLSLLRWHADPPPRSGEPTGSSGVEGVVAESRPPEPGPPGDDSAATTVPDADRRAAASAPETAASAPPREAEDQARGLSVGCKYDEGARPASGCVVEALDASGDPLATAFTDASGIAFLELPETNSELVLRARAEGSDADSEWRSGERLAWEHELKAARESGEPLWLTLYAEVVLTGTVESIDQGPISGAVIGVRPAGVVFGGQTIGEVEAVTSGDDGAFEIALPGVPCRLLVELVCADGRSQTQVVSHPDAAREPIRFVLEGLDQAYAISGTLVGLDGQDLEGAVVILLEEGGARAGVTVAPSPDGGFSFEPEAPGRYLLAARSGPFMTREPIAAVIDSEVRTAFVVLPLERTASVEGRIVRPDGEPWVEIPIGGYPTRGSGERRWLIESGFSTLSQLELTHTDGDGRFRLVGLLDDYEYELVCIPDPERPRNWVREGPIAPGSTDVLIVIDEARIRGGVLAGTAFREPQRQAIDQMYFFLSDRSEGRPWRPISKKVPLEEGAFRLEGLVVGNEYFVEALVADAGRLTIGPWIASLEEHRVELVFGIDGSARITAQYDDGQPGKGWILSMVEAGDGPRTPIQREPSGPSGTAEFKRLAAGAYVLSAERDGRVVGPIELEIEPGRCSELRVDLGAR